MIKYDPVDANGNSISGNNISTSGPSVFTAKALAPPDCSFTGATSFCSSAGIQTYTINNNPGGITYTWSITGPNTAGATISGSNTGPSVNIDPEGTTGGVYTC